ncbi:MAG: alpha-amylase [Bacteroidales bacterium]|nr:alpha-amylase [Bacteroidales bacterium]
MRDVIVEIACKKPQPPSETLTDPIHQRLASAVIYEVNIRQITPEGTFKAFTEQHIDRLSRLGVDVLWFMPTYPISVKNRKGTLGSYYSVADYKGVNPEFGSLDDLKELVRKAHDKGMLVIFDWVANHSGWDNAWIKDHPEWYTQNENGEIIAPVPDWSDVADLNYSNPELRKAMIDALEYWIKEVGIDGYRCDAAAMAPTDFWKKALLSLDSIRPLIKLAEAWEPELMANGFDAAYGWEFHHLLNDIAKGSKKFSEIESYLAKSDTLYAPDDMLMNFITNHDENSWAGTEYEKMGKHVAGFAVITYLMPGIPMLYTGQEAGLNKRLRFFEKDTVTWNDTTLYDFYRKLNALKHYNPALRAGTNAGNLVLKADSVTQTATLFRSSGENKVLGIFNFSGRAISLKVPVAEARGTYKDIFSGEQKRIRKNREIQLEPWEYWVLEGD